MNDPYWNNEQSYISNHINILTFQVNENDIVIE